MTLKLDDNDDRVECLWARTRGKVNKTDILEVVHFRLPKKTEATEKILYEKISQLLIILMRDSTSQISMENATQ